MGYRGYETARDIKTIYDSYNQPVHTLEPLRTHPQPFYRGSPGDSANRFVYGNPTSGGVQEQPNLETKRNYDIKVDGQEDDLPRGEDGEVDYSLILSGLSGLRRRMDQTGDDLKLSRDRLDVLGIQRRFIGLGQEGQIDLSQSTGEEIDWLAQPDSTIDNQIMSSDSKLDDEDVGLYEPLIGATTTTTDRKTDQKGGWRNRIPNIPLVQNPKYDLPQTVSDGPPISQNPYGPIQPPVRNPVYPDPPQQDEKKGPRQPSSTDYLVEPIPVPVLQRQHNQGIDLMPIFVSGITFGSLLLLPFLL